MTETTNPAPPPPRPWRGRWSPGVRGHLWEVINIRRKREQKIEGDERQRKSGDSVPGKPFQEKEKKEIEGERLKSDTPALKELERQMEVRGLRDTCAP